jgi:AMP-polyphosphate phosphotransferase
VIEASRLPSMLEPDLRDALLDMQRQLQQHKPCGIALIVVGMPAAGRSEVVNKLLEWLDPKHVEVHAREPDCLAGLYPPLWRYWNVLPPRGKVAIYFIGWYDEYLRSQLLGKSAKGRAPRMLERIRQLETMLLADRVRVLKLYLQIDRKQQHQRLAELRANRATRWRVTDEDRWLARHYGRVRRVMQRCVRLTHTESSPWHTIDGADAKQRVVAAGELLLGHMQAGIQRHRVNAGRDAWPEAGPALPVRSIPDPAPLTDEAYEHELERLQGRLALLVRKRRFAKRSVVLVFEGMDAAGKGGAIRRITAALDARQYQVVPVSAPTPEELSYPYLWRFWRRIPQLGHLAIFDRSWYGRVLVERVRDLTPQPDWQRAYAEICEFELQLAETGAVVQKFWLSIGKDEQLVRLQQRADDPLKRYKVDAEDWANRRFYDAYQLAASEMIERTHATHAPWTVVEADDKRHARIEVLRTVVAAIENGGGKQD